MEQKRDILDNKELRKMPYKVPEGYFAAKPAQMMAAVKEKPRQSVVRRFVPYVAAAASFLILIAGGTFLLDKHTQALPEDNYYSADAQLYNEISEEDMIAYLIYSGAHVEEFEFSDFFAE
ncbi:MAG: hypothetical protein KBT05_00840 [Bacteroidales bacterium]|nr:hypothetical protein [Candidatus Cryptobacteroides caccocaballi]